jgi:HEAT repeat protein
MVARPGVALDSPDPTIRRLAVAAAVADPCLHPQLVAMLRNDPEPLVRRECAEVLGLIDLEDHAALVSALADTNAQVREAAVTALGELESASAAPRLLALAHQDPDNLVREAAVAALGAIGDVAALPTLLELIRNGPPQVRRRCVAALTVFDGPEVEAALRSAASDRNPMVREAAEMVVGRTTE